jgi:hypothetical protein
MNPQRGGKGNLWYRERKKKSTLKKLRGHSQTPLLWACQVDEALLPICT